MIITGASYRKIEEKKDSEEKYESLLKNNDQEVQKSRAQLMKERNLRLKERDSNAKNQ